MKKLITSILAVGLLAGCGGQDESIEQRATVETQIASETIGKYDEYQVEKTEYNSLDEMMNHFAESIEPASEYKANQTEADAERQLAFAALHYINYFEDEIEAIGMTEEFKTLQDAAYAANYNDSKDQTIIDEFEATFFEVYETYSQK